MAALPGLLVLPVGLAVGGKTALVTPEPRDRGTLEATGLVGVGVVLARWGLLVEA
jgi:hypothetical protein